MGISPLPDPLAHRTDSSLASPFAGNESYIPTGDQAEMTPHAQRMIFESILNSRGGAPKQPQQRSGRSSAQNSVRTSKHIRRARGKRGLRSRTHKMTGADSRRTRGGRRTTRDGEDKKVDGATTRCRLAREAGDLHGTSGGLAMQGEATRTVRVHATARGGTT
jgi:hypothetical protein